MAYRRPQAWPPDRFQDLAAIRTAWTELEREVREFANEWTDERLKEVMDYRMLNGQAGRSPLWQMVQHMVNHGSYHRGQVTTMLRQLGAAPPKSLDLIAFYRERGAKGDGLVAGAPGGGASALRKARGHCRRWNARAAVELQRALSLIFADGLNAPRSSRCDMSRR